MKAKTNKVTKTRKTYAVEFKEGALAVAEQQGVPKAAADLGLPEPMLYGWRVKKRHTGQTFEDQKLQQAEMARLKRDNARLEEEVAFLKKAAAYFAKQPK